MGVRRRWRPERIQGDSHYAEFLFDGYRYTLDRGLHKGVITPGQGIESHMPFTLQDPDQNDDPAAVPETPQLDFTLPWDCDALNAASMTTAYHPKAPAPGPRVAPARPTPPEDPPEEAPPAGSARKPPQEPLVGKNSCNRTNQKGLQSENSRVGPRGVTYYLYRYYDPTTGSWPSRDPINEKSFWATAGKTGHFKGLITEKPIERLRSAGNWLARMAAQRQLSAWLEGAADPSQMAEGLRLMKGCDYFFVDNDPTNSFDKFGLDRELKAYFLSGMNDQNYEEGKCCTPDGTIWKR